MAESQDWFATQLGMSFLKPPLSFEANVGQVDTHLFHFLARGPGCGVLFTSTEAVLVVQGPSSHPHSDGLAGQPGDPPDPLKEATLRFRFLGVEARTAFPTGRHQLPGQSHYSLAMTRPGGIPTSPSMPRWSTKGSIPVST
jgi:hypothetical protein